MSRLFIVYIFVNLNCICIECILPGILAKLSVRKVDQKIIDRKRQDTLEMCRIFTEETKNLQKIKLSNKHTKMFPKSKINPRIKRGVQEINYAMKAGDSQRVQKIVDKLYDNLLDNSKKIGYRRNEISTANNISKIIGRKYFFAPKELEYSNRMPQSYQEPDNQSSSAISGDTQRFKHGIIPYYIDSKSYDGHLVEIISMAFDYLEKATCLRLQRLRERPTDTASLKEVAWLYITNPSGIRQCVHSNEQAKVKGVRMIIFGYDCMFLGDILHELMHVLGFSHEHLRPDRDQYITILWDNIKPGYKKYFEIRNTSTFKSLPYDFSSVLHYPPRAFSRNGQVTIMTQPGIKIGQRESLSNIDVEKISSMYAAECVQRNREYLLTTCPSVVRANISRPANTSMEDIEKYYAKKLWPFGIVNYRMGDAHFSEEEKDNIKTVIHHIEKETCIEFRNIDINSNDSNSDEEELNDECSKTADKMVNDHTKTNNQSKNVSRKEATKKLKYATVNNRSRHATDTDQIQSGKETENEIMNDEAYKSDEYNVLSNDESSMAVSPNEVSLRGTKKFLRVKSSSHMKAKKRLSSNLTKIYEEVTKNYRNKYTAVPLSPSRRHATSVITFIRSTKTGCVCPKSPGAPANTSIIEINADCFNSVNDLLHLFVHILGLGHQHNSHDRDSYLHIVWDQLTDDVKEDMKEKLPPVASVGFPYDYQSVMHFPCLQIKNGRTNIMYPIWNDGWAMGHWQGLSFTDVQKLNILYAKQCDLRKKIAEELV